MAAGVSPASAVSRKAASATQALESADQKNSLSRFEFITALVMLAINKYVATGQMRDVSDAVHRLLSEDILRHMPAGCPDPNAFRREHCYSESVCRELEKREASLRILFPCAADQTQM